MKKVHQLGLVMAIAKAIESLGIKDLEPRHINAITEAANMLEKELNRDSVPAKDGMGLQAWLMSDDTGMSSKYMAYIIKGGPRCEPAIPHDPSDFGRCYRFRRAFVPPVPVDLMAKCGPAWELYVRNWDAMERLYEEELPSGNAPKLYAMMQRLQSQAKEAP